MVASGKCDFNPGVADSDQLSDLSCTSSFLSDGAAAVFGAAAGALVLSDAAVPLLVGPVLWLRSFFDGPCAVAVVFFYAAFSYFDGSCAVVLSSLLPLSPLPRMMRLPY